MHTGEPLLTGEGYVGIDVHRAARIAAVMAARNAGTKMRLNDAIEYAVTNVD